MKEVDVDHVQWVMELFAEEAILSESRIKRLYINLSCSL